MSETRRRTATTAGPIGRMLDGAFSNTTFWWLLPITGIAWIVLSVVILRFDYTAVAAVAVLVGVYCLIAAATQTMIAAVSSCTGWSIAHGLLASLLAMTGVVSSQTSAEPSTRSRPSSVPTSILRGCFDIAFAANMLSGWWFLLICGFIELGLGFWAAGSWNASIVVLVAWVATAALVYSIGDTALSFQMQYGRSAASRVNGFSSSRGGDEFAAGGQWL